VLPHRLKSQSITSQITAQVTQKQSLLNPADVGRFIALSDCAAVMVNALTGFTGVEQMGFGAEIGISN